MVQLYPPYQNGDDTDDSDSAWSSSDQDEEKYEELSRRRRDQQEDGYRDLLLEPPEQFADVDDVLGNNETDNDGAIRNHIDTNHFSLTDCECEKSAGQSFQRFNDFISDLSRIVNLHSIIFNNIFIIKMHELFALVKKSFSTAKSNEEESHHQADNFGNTRRSDVRENGKLGATVSECETVVKNDSDKQMTQAANPSCSYISNCGLELKEVTEEIIVKEVAPTGLSATPFNYIQTPEEERSDGYDYVFAERRMSRGWTNIDNQSLDDWNVCNIPQMNVLDSNQRNVSEEAASSTRDR